MAPFCSSVKAYFIERVFEGKPKKAEKAFDKLEPAELKKVKREAKKCMSDYMKQLERYLKSLTKEEMVEYANRSRQQVPGQKEDEFLSSDTDC